MIKNRRHISKSSLINLTRELLFAAIPAAYIIFVAIVENKCTGCTTLTTLFVLIPVVLFGFFFGRMGTLYVIGIMAVVVLVSAVEGSPPFWIVLAVMPVMAALSFVGERLSRFSHRKNVSSDNSARD